MSSHTYPLTIEGLHFNIVLDSDASFDILAVIYATMCKNVQTSIPYRIMAERANMSGKTPYIFVLRVNFNHPDIDVEQARRLYREYLHTNINEGLQK